jgi:hypothetical protein
MHAILSKSAGQESLALRIVWLFTGDVFAEFKPAPQRSYRITCVGRGISTNQGNSYPDPPVRRGRLGSQWPSTDQ